MANISVWDPVNSIRSDFEKLFVDVVPVSIRRLWGMEPGVTEPSVDVIEKNDMIMVKAEVPGISKDDLKLEVHDNKLTIKGEHKTEKEEKKENYYRKEISFGSFYRCVELPSEVANDSASATLKDGILEVSLKKIAPSKPIEIEVK